MEQMSDCEISLRPIEESDVTDRYLSWFRDADVVRYLEARNLTRDEVLAFIRNGRDTTRFMEAICLVDSGLHVGNVKIDVNWRHSTGNLSIFVGEKALWGKGIATSAIRSMTQKAFINLKIRHLTAGAYAVNLGSLRCFERAGWRLDGLRRDHLILDGRPIDSVSMAISNPGEWVFIPPQPVQDLRLA